MRIKVRALNPASMLLVGLFSFCGFSQTSCLATMSGWVTWPEIVLQLNITGKDHESLAIPGIQTAILDDELTYDESGNVVCSRKFNQNESISDYWSSTDADESGSFTLVIPEKKVSTGGVVIGFVPVFDGRRDNRLLAFRLFPDQPLLFLYPRAPAPVFLIGRRVDGGWQKDHLDIVPLSPDDPFEVVDIDVENGQISATIRAKIR